MFPALAAEAGTLLSALRSGLEAFTASVLVNGLDMAISGDFDLGELLKGAAFSQSLMRTVVNLALADVQQGPQEE
ncbi:MAG TPA: hypothetical protein DCS30_02140 [Rhizobiales bacterium]|nr:hypothetical protein [Hyphomicrobiales bacterium]